MCVCVFIIGASVISLFQTSQQVIFIMVGIVRGSASLTRPSLCLPVFWVPRLDCLGFMIHVIPAEMTGCGDRLGLSLSLSLCLCLPPSLIRSFPTMSRGSHYSRPHFHLCLGRRLTCGIAQRPQLSLVE